MPAPPAEIRVYAPVDEPHVVDLWQRCGLLVPRNDPHRDIATKRAFQPDLFFVADREGHVVGTVMAGYEGHRGWIHYLAVDPAAQGSGLGRRLMDTAESALRALGCPKINLQVRTRNAAVLGFYQRLGYTPDDVTPLGKPLTSQRKS